MPVNNFRDLALMAEKPTKPTTPEEEGIDLHPDSWKRFERTVDKVVNAPPAHRTGKSIDAHHPRKSGRAKSNG